MTLPNFFFRKKLFNTNQLYRPDTNEKVPSEQEGGMSDQLQGQIAFDYLIQKRALKVLDMLLCIPNYEVELIDPSSILGIKRAVLLADVDNKYIRLLGKAVKEVKMCLLTQEIFETHISWFSETTLNDILEQMLVAFERGIILVR